MLVAHVGLGCVWCWGDLKTFYDQTVLQWLSNILSNLKTPHHGNIVLASRQAVEREEALYG